MQVVVEERNVLFNDALDTHNMVMTYEVMWHQTQIVREETYYCHFMDNSF